MAGVSRSNIELVTDEYPLETLQARIDQSIVTGKPMIEKPYHFRNIATGQAYYGIYGCVGWPSPQASEQAGKDSRPGYLGVIGVVKLKSDTIKVEDTVFQLLDEAQEQDVLCLMRRWLEMRARWGHLVIPEMLSSLYGNPDRFVMTMAMLNDRLGERDSVSIAAPYDFYDTLMFDTYLRSLRSVFTPQAMYAPLSSSREALMPRFFHGGHEVLKTRLREFGQDDPVIVAVGGLVHSLLIQTMWMEQRSENAFVI
jgi:hypothetical protein